MNPIDPEQIKDVVAAIIRRARQLVERGWCQHTPAQKYYGPSVEPLAVHPMAPDATHFCLEGALLRAAVEVSADAYQRQDLLRAAVGRVAGILGTSFQMLTAYNDYPGRQQAAVLKILDLAAGGK